MEEMSVQDKTAICGAKQYEAAYFARILQHFKFKITVFFDPGSVSYSIHGAYMTLYKLADANHSESDIELPDVWAKSLKNPVLSRLSLRLEDITEVSFLDDL